MDKAEALKTIAIHAGRGELVFPTNMNASLKIRQALDDPHCSMETAARLVMTEPLLAARVVAIANSVAYSRFGGGVTNIKTAITILGFNTLNSIVAAVVMRQLSHAVRNPAIRAMMDRLWAHSAHVAALAFVLASEVSHVDAETAIFAGIVHEVAGFYLLTRAEEFPALLEIDPVPDPDATPAEPSEPSESVIGRAVLNKLLVPKRVIAAVEALWHGQHQLPPTTLGETLLLANELAPIASPLDQRPAEQLAHTAATLDFDLDDGSLREKLDQATDKIEALTQALLS